MKCLVLTDTFPNRLQPWRGPYNRRQVECLAKLCPVAVVNPIPWTRLLCSARSWTLVGRPDNVLNRIVMHHPVFWYLPLAGRGGTWRGVLSAARRSLRSPDRPQHDIVLATFAYPHGLAAGHIAQDLQIPCVIKVRGSDLHALPPQGARRDHTAQALQRAAAVIAVSRNLADIAAELGAPSGHIHVLPNGIDAAAFPILPRDQAREKLALPQEAKILLFVGSLLPVKGIDVLIEAAARANARQRSSRPWLLVVAGTGPLRKTIERAIGRTASDRTVRLVGHLSRDDVALWMNAADCLVLPSRNEGCPNVILEALACGTPVVASRVGAVPDLLDRTCGVIVEPGNPGLLAQAINHALNTEWDRPALRRRIEGMSWEANAQELHRILAEVVEAHGRRASAK